MNVTRTVLLILLAVTAAPAMAEETAKMDIFTGHFSREGNNETPSKATNNSIYIKLYQKNRIAVLYVPFPYSKKVTPGMIDAVFDRAGQLITTNSYTRSTFNVLDETAILHMETYHPVKDQLQFECDSMSPCAIRFGDNYLELIKGGVINEHIIRFNHLTGAKDAK